MSYKVFIDGKAGTTGLRIYERLSERNDINLITISEEKRKDLNSRIDAINSSDLSFLCLPDVASKEIVPLVKKDIRICDTSTAHRVSPEWTYGFAEINKRREIIGKSYRTAVPGCHASGFISLIAPLREKEIIDCYTDLSCYSLTGYSGGGKSMIEQYEDENRESKFGSPRIYGLTLAHKHLPEMMGICNINKKPVFVPVVADYFSGMLVSVPLRSDDLKNGYKAKDLGEFYEEYYMGEKLIKVNEINQMPDDNFLASNMYSGRDSMEINIFTNGEEILLTSLFDNLGKGASGAAIQCMNIMLGLNETEGLNI